MLTLFYFKVLKNWFQNVFKFWCNYHQKKLPFVQTFFSSPQIGPNRPNGLGKSTVTNKQLFKGHNSDKVENILTKCGYKHHP